MRASRNRSGYPNNAESIEYARLRGVMDSVSGLLTLRFVHFGSSPGHPILLLLIVYCVQYCRVVS